MGCNNVRYIPVPIPDKAVDKNISLIAKFVDGNNNVSKDSKVLLTLINNTNDTFVLDKTPLTIRMNPMYRSVNETYYRILYPPGSYVYAGTFILPPKGNYSEQMKFNVSLESGKYEIYYTYYSAIGNDTLPKLLAVSDIIRFAVK